ncbi:Glycoside hydrolase/deacetylase, beta/alpha-barrel [Acididesulfobacillus acetoxydans]|uniref:Glycoside hydrolase/deacetylase, beta/alpha-barrel n=1 Tax=Acididesulfobacillus acetoxydans TaxID=1561005 RepID=A0A8S0XZ89_9FIRM|nr:polysaccharide deacetylase family protein [Acididesulfobacillus acetoxydans]CAA7602427.1 Glycoside hydrolase/deacetylase, beta/alpha-barrel [Acididesulfobacillus acetoxydans]CEJ08338.1 Glycoside hydrolase/deacetylase, beta/alpha-barrel [Acididesulfobacillus acetoxydans]
MPDDQPRKHIYGNPRLRQVLIGLVTLCIVIALPILLYPQRTAIEPLQPRPGSHGPSPGQRSESLTQLGSTLKSGGPVQVIYNLPGKERVVYITMDDGWFPNEDIVKLMREYRIPVTTFLIEQAAREHAAFWHEFVSAGGRIEDHTFSHPFLTHLPPAAEESQIARPLAYFRQFGPVPDELRPPYGDFNSTVEQAAREAGIKYIVMWDAEMEQSKLTTVHKQGLQPGDIILLHWVPGVDREMLQLLNIIRAKNLGIADLSQTLAGGSPPICRLTSPVPVPATSTHQTVPEAAYRGTQMRQKSKGA